MKTKIQKKRMRKSNSKNRSKTKKIKKTQKYISGGNNKDPKEYHKHNHNKTIKLKNMNCSPKPKNEINKFSCYTNKTLLKLRDLWNARHPDAKISSNSPKE